MTDLPVRYEPASLVSEMHRGIDRIFDSLMNGAWTNGNGSRGWFVPVDVVEKDDAIVARLDLPGVRKDDLTIEVDDGVLTVRGERSAEREVSGAGFERIERSFGRFSRSLRVPRNVDAERIEAKLDHGVLELRMPKTEETKARRIEITSGE